MSRAKREPREVRYQKILQAALPLFGKKGYAATTTRELSRAAGVSDALLYKYFPSKAAIFKGLIDFCTRRGEDVGEKLKKLEPSTESFIKSIYFLFHMVVYGAPEAKKVKPHLDHLLLQSLAGDGALAKGFHESKLAPWVRELVEGGFRAAKDAGDLVAGEDSPSNRIWFAYHVAFNYLVFNVPASKPIHYEGDSEKVFNEAVSFALRGIGLKSEAIHRYFDPVGLRHFVREILESGPSK